MGINLIHLNPSHQTIFHPSPYHNTGQQLACAPFTGSYCCFSILSFMTSFTTAFNLCCLATNACEECPESLSTSWFATSFPYSVNVPHLTIPLGLTNVCVFIKDLLRSCHLSPQSFHNVEVGEERRTSVVNLTRRTVAR